MSAQRRKAIVPAISSEECDRAENAIEQEQMTGKTELMGLRCGTRYVFEDYGSGYVIRCETEECFYMTVRGI